MNYRRVILILLALLAIRVFVAATTPVFETSEARYAAISANMARTGDFLVPHYTYHGEYVSFDGKPPLLFQLAGAACRVSCVHELPVRLPVILANLLMMFLMWKAVRTVADSARAWLSVCIVGTCVSFYAISGFCMPDGLLTPCVASAYFLHLLYLTSGNRNWSVGTFAALGLGMIVKGPVALVLFGFPVLIDTIVNHRWRAIGRMRWVAGLAVFLLIAAPWFVLMTRENPGFLKYFFVNENLLRFVTHEYGDKYGAGREYFRGMALVWLIVLSLPWTPLALYRAYAAIRSDGWRAALRDSLRGGGSAAVLLWSVAGITFFWCLTSRVPAGYLMPAIPVFAAALALGVKDASFSLRRLFPVTALIAVVVFCGGLGVTMLTSNKMKGAAAEYSPKCYSFEFYHGTPSFAKEVDK